MRYISTTGKTPPTTLLEALWRGLAPDGGLFIPETIPSLEPNTIESWRDAAIAEVATDMIAPFTNEWLDRATLSPLLAEALPFDAPLREIGANTWLLELFHGPTFAFKDFGARTLARFISRSHQDTRPLTVLVATSGDTGSAVAHAFLGLPNIRVVVLYPRGQVSPLQEAQFATLGRNVDAFAVDGTFDDCQRLVKEAFADEALRREMVLTSANSINIGRLLPQMAYYARAVAQLPRESSPLVVVPSGNFGNLIAGLMAKRMGVPMASCLAATNANDAVPLFLTSGTYEPRPSICTLSNAMDVGAPSNFARLLHLYRGDLDAIRADVRGASVSDDATRATIERTYRATGVIIDPHTAVGLAALEAERRHDPTLAARPAIVLATAHPAKFGDIVSPLIGREVDIPQALASCLQSPNLSQRLPAGTTLASVLRALQRPSS